jgi:hypothetical protein
LVRVKLPKLPHRLCVRMRTLNAILVQAFHSSANTYKVQQQQRSRDVVLQVVLVRRLRRALNQHLYPRQLHQIATSSFYKSIVITSVA